MCEAVIGTYPLAFTTRQFQPTFSNLCLVLIGEGKNTIMNVRSLACLVDVLLGGVGVGVQQVVHDGGIEQDRVLWNHTNVPSEAVDLQIPDIMPINSDRAVLDIVEAEQQLERS